MTLTDQEAGAGRRGVLQPGGIRRKAHKQQNPEPEVPNSAQIQKRTNQHEEPMGSVSGAIESTRWVPSESAGAGGSERAASDGAKVMSK